MASMFTDLNENDARAALKAWGQTVARERGIPTDPEPQILQGMEALRRALRDRTVDAIGLTTAEYAELAPSTDLAPVFVALNRSNTTERYVLLVHQESPIQTVADLGGHKLLVHSNPRMCLALPWLDLVRQQAGLPPSSNSTGAVSRLAKLSSAVLPVFFRKSDACLVTRKGFDTMCELNPQLLRQLRVLAESPDYVPVMFGFRPDYDSPAKARLFEALTQLHQSPAGQQVLTVFQSERLVEQPITVLRDGLALIANARRPAAATDPLPAGTSGAPPATGAPTAP